MWYEPWLWSWPQPWWGWPPYPLRRLTGLGTPAQNRASAPCRILSDKSNVRHNNPQMWDTIDWIASAPDLTPRPGDRLSNFKCHSMLLPRVGQWHCPCHHVTVTVIITWHQMTRKIRFKIYIFLSTVPLFVFWWPDQCFFSLSSTTYPILSVFM